MKVLITGGAGFLGQRLARELLARGAVKDEHGKPQAITELVLLDVVHGSDFGDSRVLNLPGISVSVDEMVAALREVAGEEAVKRIVWAPDARVKKIVGSWPGQWDSARAERLGLSGDRSFADVIRGYIADEQIPIS